MCTSVAINISPYSYEDKAVNLKCMVALLQIFWKMGQTWRSCWQWCPWKANTEIIKKSSRPGALLKKKKNQMSMRGNNSFPTILKGFSKASLIRLAFIWATVRHSSFGVSGSFKQNHSFYIRCHCNTKNPSAWMKSIGQSLPQTLWF